MRILMISADNFEDMELFYPFYRLREEGIDVTLASVKKGKIAGENGYQADADVAVADVDLAGFDALLLPGGKAPATLRKDGKVLDAARHFMEAGKPVAAICHGPQVLISARVLRGRHATCYTTVAKELKEAGAIYEDSEVVVDGNLVTSRHPPDLPAFMREFMRLLKRTEDQDRTRRADAFSFESPE
jgi:protease I